MSNQEDDTLNPSKRAASHLNTILDASADVSDEVVIVDERVAERVRVRAEEAAIPEPEEEIVPELPSVKLTEARKEESVLVHTEIRQSTRLLLITKDIHVRDEGSEIHRRITDLRNRFLEIHIVLINSVDPDSDIDTDTATERLFENVWLYPTNSSAPWKWWFQAYSIIKSQLEFSGGFRADIVIADDPAVAGMVGWYVSRKYKRPFLLHVQEDFFDKEFVGTMKYPGFYDWCVAYVLEHATHVRTDTEEQRLAVIHERPELENTVEGLPQYYPLDLWKDFQPTATLREFYPQFKFTMLHVSTMHTNSRTASVIAGAARIMHRYPALGLIIAGNGPLRAQLEANVIALGIQKQVEFLPMPEEILSYITSTNLCVHMSEDPGDDEFLLKAAMAKVPLVANAQGLGGKIFVEGESACLCEPGDVKCIADGINRYLNENQTRTHFALNAFEATLDRVEQNYGAYLEAYALSIERCMVESNKAA
ncbi:glycosyltransferase [Candidatus Kaiserbacteria bacterium]|nr:MAG: glycosyltransferase [Candidatus Kaiserbacteria bacterium]